MRPSGGDPFNASGWRVWFRRDHQRVDVAWAGGDDRVRAAYRQIIQWLAPLCRRRRHRDRAERYPTARASLEPTSSAPLETSRQMDFGDALMREKTYGYASRVGEWLGSIELPESARQPIPAIEHVFDNLRPSLETIHRPTKLRVSWAEFATASEEEAAFHELQEYPLSAWDDAVERLKQLQASTSNRFAISCLFAKLETRIVEPDREVWLPDSADLQCSIAEPELAPTTVEVRYSTYIDAWLSMTYDKDGQPSDNRRIAAINRAGLEFVVAALRSLMGNSFEVGQSQLYPFAITESGFRDVNDLRARKR